MRFVSLFLIGICLAETQEMPDDPLAKRMPSKYKKGEGRQSVKTEVSSTLETSLKKEFLKQDMKTKKKLCGGLAEIDYSIESAVKVMTKMLDLLEVTSTIDEVESKLTVMLNFEKLEELKAIPLDTQLVRIQKVYFSHKLVDDFGTVRQPE